MEKFQLSTTEKISINSLISKLNLENYNSKVLDKTYLIEKKNLYAIFIPKGTRYLLIIDNMFKPFTVWIDQSHTFFKNILDINSELFNGTTILDIFIDNTSETLYIIDILYLNSLNIGKNNYLDRKKCIKINKIFSKNISFKVKWISYSNSTKLKTPDYLFENVWFISKYSSGIRWVPDKSEELEKGFVFEFSSAIIIDNYKLIYKNLPKKFKNFKKQKYLYLQDINDSIMMEKITRNKNAKVFCILDSENRWIPNRIIS